ncbi:MAG: type I phosphomannose isomerase catalytic subunit [Romboutsia timonensis]|uniref:type I phosphomannose isomerase catalytic subunit n=1 Tax=Romboutsia timonensis TaxID=1776391 RepID=UPI002A74CB1C|nr:type I phosphomannose isomerase catalytic subunit [Romboutsia timonensis]MDY2883009.1 type I phosphomannose isomerase catalytic subunit [Romboutsia timonensis]
MGILKLKPFYFEKIWGYEKWNLSTHKNGYSTVENTNNTLINEIHRELPILIKIINAEDTLSVQVHPDDKYARKYENDNGKAECWYILEAKEDATLICGIEEGYDRESLNTLIENQQIEKCLKKISVQPGDMIYIPSGTIHAIQGGIKLVEIQQSSDITYRMYDWGRNRELHIKKSLDVIDYNNKNKCGKIENFSKLITPYFSVEKLNISGIYKDKVNSDFCTFTVTAGSGIIKYNDVEINIKKEETVYILKNTVYIIEGNLTLLKSYI